MQQLSPVDTKIKIDLCSSGSSKSKLTRMLYKFLQVVIQRFFNQSLRKLSYSNKVVNFMGIECQDFNKLIVKKVAATTSARASRHPGPDLETGTIIYMSLICRLLLSLFFPGDCMVFGADELASACSNYRKANHIGRGGFGNVYRGTLRGCLNVAVKVLTGIF